MNERNTSQKTQGEGVRAGMGGKSLNGSWNRANKGPGVEEVREVKTARSCRTQQAGPNLHQMSNSQLKLTMTSSVVPLREGREEGRKSLEVHTTPLTHPSVKRDCLFVG